MKHIGLAAVLLTGALLLLATRDFPAWGDPRSPANDNPVSRHYITQTLDETAVPNFVTAVLADYRGFDTLFETVVILTAGLAIVGILGLRPMTRPAPVCDPEEYAAQRDMIVIVTCRLLIPVIQLFALYVVAHGHHSPGGGFQGGVIFGTSLILLSLSQGLSSALLQVSERRALCLALLGIGLYAGTGLLCLLLGGNFLDYSQLHRILPATDPVMARSHGMLLVEIGVAFTVASTMFAIYANLATRGRLKEGL